MKRLIPVLPIFAALISIVAYIWVTPDVALGSPAPIKTVERISFAREAATEKGTRFKLLSVKCAATGTEYIYVCNFAGLNGKQPLCAATYIHYHKGHTGKYRINFFSETWRCGTAPPVPPPPYPGDSGPAS